MAGLWRSALLVVVTAIAVLWLPSLLRKQKPPQLGGSVKPGWEKVQEVFRRRLESGEELGAAFAVYHRGEPVVQLHGGSADDGADLAWRPNTLSCFYSTTKGVAAIVIALLVERGHLDYDQPVSKYWPQFAQNGKDQVTVKQLMSHQAGLSALDEPISAYDLKDDPGKVSRIAAKSSPLWKLGEGSGYHSLTIGIYADQLVRRVDPQHRNISQFYEDEIRKPLGADFYIGLPRSEHFRVARYHKLSPGGMLWQIARFPEDGIVFFNFMMAKEDNMLTKSLKTIPELQEGFVFNNPNLREIQLASVTGFGTAEGVARIWGAVADGKLLKPDTVRRLSAPGVSGKDRVIGRQTTFAAGVIVNESPEGNPVIGHPGAGGQIGMMDYKRELGWAYLTNHQSFQMYTENYKAYISAMYEAVRDIE